MYCPTAEVFTVPVTKTGQIPSISSKAVAPGSLKSLPTIIEIILSPFNVMTGGVKSCCIVNVASMVCGAVTFVNVYVGVTARFTPSTVSVEILYPVSGIML